MRIEYFLYALLFCTSSLFAQNDTTITQPHQEPIQLNEVTINHHSKKLIRLGYAPSEGFFRGWFEDQLRQSALGGNLPPGYEFLTVAIPMDPYKTKKIEKISFQFFKRRFIKRKAAKFYRNRIGVFQVNIYKNENGKKGEKIYTGDLMQHPICKHRLVEIDLSGKSIFWNPAGLCFEMQVVGNLDENGNISKEKEYLISSSYTISPMIGMSATTIYYDLSNGLFFPFGRAKNGNEENWAISVFVSGE